jgi:hypothetical protein
MRPPVFFSTTAPCVQAFFYSPCHQTIMAGQFDSFDHAKMRNIAVENAKIRVEEVIVAAAEHGNIAFFVDASRWDAMTDKFRDQYIEVGRSSGQCTIKFRV